VVTNFQLKKKKIPQQKGNMQPKYFYFWHLCKISNQRKKVGAMVSSSLPMVPRFIKKNIPK
jgi:hypothetical protein